MGVFNKMKDGISNFIHVTDDDYDNENYSTAEQLAPAPEPAPAPAVRESYQPAPRQYDNRNIRKEKKGNILSMKGNNISAPSADSQVVLRKVSSVADVGAVADILKAGHIVVLNLENCNPDHVQRVIDILFGVSYAIDGTFKPIADKAFVITPYNVTVTADEIAGQMTEEE